MLYTNKSVSGFILLCGLFLVLNSKAVNAQIAISDPSFEDVDFNLQKFYTWKVCQGTPYVWVKEASFGNQFQPSSRPPTNGDYCIHLGGGDIDTLSYLNQIIGIKLGCPLLKSKPHYFYFDLSSIVVYLNNPLDNQDRGQIRILLGDSLCKYNQVAWVSPMLDSVWQRYKVEFIPDDNYQYLAIEGWCITKGSTGDEWVDNLSPIYIDDKIGDVKVSVTKQQIAAGECVQLSSEVFTTYKTITWSSEPQGFSSTLQNPKEVCLTQTTKYKVQLTDSCGYNAWDTITVYVHNECGYNLPTLIKTNESLVANYEGLSMAIYNSIGQLVYQTENYNDTWQPTTQGLYIVFVRCVNGSKRSFKLVVEGS